MLENALATYCLNDLSMSNADTVTTHALDLVLGNPLPIYGITMIL